MSDLLVTTPVGFALTADGDLDFTARRLSWASGLAGIVQGVRTRMWLVRGELFYNLDAGVPWFYRSSEPALDWDGVSKSIALLGQKFSAERTRAALRPAILETPGVRRIASMAITFNSGTRLLSVAWSATTIWGETTTTNTLDRGL